MKTRCHKINVLLSNARSRCKNESPRNTKYYINKGIKCLLTLEDMNILWERDNAQELEKPSLDRIDSNGNYELGNCQIIEWSINRVKRTYNKKVSIPTYRKRKKLPCDVRYHADIGYYKEVKRTLVKSHKVVNSDTGEETEFVQTRPDWVKVKLTKNECLALL